MLISFATGIWDCQSSQAVVEFVRRGIAAKQELYRICENMMDNCLSANSETGGVGCDNMTMVIIALLNGKTKDDWYQLIADRVAKGDGPCAPPEYGKRSQYPDNLAHITKLKQPNSAVPTGVLDLTTAPTNMTQACKPNFPPAATAESSFSATAPRY